MTTDNSTSTTGVLKENGPIYFKVGARQYRLAFTILQWELQLKLTEEHPGAIGGLASMIYSAMSIAHRHDEIGDFPKTELPVPFEDVETEVDRLMAADPKAFDYATAYRNEVPFFKKALIDVAELQKSTSPNLALQSVMDSK